MNPFKPTLFACSPLVERLRVDGCRVYELSETYRPSRISVSTDEPLPSFTPTARFGLRQWLVDAGPSSQISLQAGLLYWRSSCLYETNLLNQAGFQRIISSFFHRPPGFWHRQRSSTHIARPLVFLSTHNNPNYFHWLTQPGLSPLFLQDYFGLPQLPNLALSYRPRSRMPSFLPELLDVFATGSPRIQGVSLSSNAGCRFAIQEHRTEVVVSPSQLDWLRARCRRLLPSSKPWRKLLISRHRSRCRRCLNETSIMSALEPYGFELIFLEDMSVKEQLRYFSESVVVVGVHGAGFTNLVACSSQAAIVELLPRPGHFNHYYAIADVLGLTHGHLVATSFESDTDDFSISPDKLIDLLRKMNLL